MTSFLAGFTAVTLVSDIFRVLFFTLDITIYGLIPLIYEMIYSLYNIETIFSGNQFSNILNSVTTTIYSFLAIFMFFRVAFSLITMLVDPNIIDDNERGAKKIVTNIMICLVLIVVVPIVFDYAKMIQTRVIEDKLIEKVFYTENYGTTESNLGKKLARSVMGIFLSPNEGNTGAITVSTYNKVFKDDWNLALLLPLINSITPSSIIKSLFDDQKGITFYSYSYTWPISTIVGLYLLWMFIQMMIDVAYRSIKFLALELLSPIAIVSYISPNSAKNGLFSKWLNETFKTYVSLFVRIFVYSFASVLLSQITVVDLNGNILQNLFFILAVVAFLKTAPKFIDNLFGTSISKESDTKFVSNMLKGVLGAATVGTVSLATSAVKTRGMSNINRAKTIISSTWTGAKKGYSGGQKNGIRGVVGAGFDSYGSINKATGTMDFWSKAESKENEQLSDRVEKARIPNNPNAGTFFKKDAQGHTFIDSNGNAQLDENAIKDFLYGDQKYKHIKVDKGVMYQIEKANKKRSELQQLKKEGLSQKAFELEEEQLVAEQKAALDEMEYQTIEGMISQKKMESANVSMNTATVRGFSVGVGGVYATQERANAAFDFDRKNLENEKNNILNELQNLELVMQSTTDQTRINQAIGRKDELNIRLSNVEKQIVNTKQENYKVATSQDSVFASENDAIIAVNAQINREIEVLEEEKTDMFQKREKSKSIVLKNKAKLNAHYKENKNDQNIMERLKSGDRARGRDKDN